MTPSIVRFRAFAFVGLVAAFLFLLRRHETEPAAPEETLGWAMAHRRVHPEHVGTCWRCAKIIGARPLSPAERTEYDAIGESDRLIQPADHRLISIASLLDELRAQPSLYPSPNVQYWRVGTTARQTHWWLALRPPTPKSSCRPSSRRKPRSWPRSLVSAPCWTSPPPVRTTSRVGVLSPLSTRQSARDECSPRMSLS